MSKPDQQERPALGQEYTTGAPEPPRQAATVILLREEQSRPEVLLVKRTPHARFMGGVWVFPGGAVEDSEGQGEQAYRSAAVRELREEAGVILEDPAALVKFSRWITPAQAKIRFDTHFFLALLPAGQAPEIDGEECVDLGWFTPQAALRAQHSGEIMLVFPTIKHLEALSKFHNVGELLSQARGREVPAIEPRVILDGESTRVVLPGEPGYR